MSVGLPRVRRAARRAWSSVIPRARWSSMSIWRCASSSRARSASQCRRRKNRLRLIGVTRSSRRPEDAVDGADDVVPAAGLRGELPASARREAIEAGAPVVVGGAPVRRDPAAILEPVERRVERSVLDLEHLVRPERDGVRDRVAVGRSEHERAQDQQIERSLQQLSLHRRASAFRHLQKIIYLKAALRSTIYGTAGGREWLADPP